MIKSFILKNKLMLLGVLLGGIVGYLYYHFIGCVTGTCAITSKPVNSTVYFAVMGGLGFSMLKKSEKSDVRSEK
jgi:phage shock protein E